MNPDKNPEVDHKPIPLWIKVMWVLGITWVVGYIFLGLQHTPLNW